MAEKKYIILNFTHGNGPFLRTTELAIAINDLLEKKGLDRFGIIVPWVYRERQRTVMKENFTDVIKKHPNEILLDKNIGSHLGLLFYGEKTYEESLIALADNHESIGGKINEYLSGGLEVENFSGEKFSIKKENIAMEINRCPVIGFNVGPSYFTSFAYMSEILERSLGEDKISIDKDVLNRLIPYYSSLEKKQSMQFIAEPSTFSYMGNVTSALPIRMA